MHFFFDVARNRGEPKRDVFASFSSEAFSRRVNHQFSGAIWSAPPANDLLHQPAGALRDGRGNEEGDGFTKSLRDEDASIMQAFQGLGLDQEMEWWQGATPKPLDQATANAQIGSYVIRRVFADRDPFIARAIQLSAKRPV